MSLVGQVSMLSQRSGLRLLLAAFIACRIVEQKRNGQQAHVGYWQHPSGDGVFKPTCHSEHGAYAVTVANVPPAQT
jgi:hypothetical protein